MYSSVSQEVTSNYLDIFVCNDHFPDIISTFGMNFAILLNITKII